MTIEYHRVSGHIAVHDENSKAWDQTLPGQFLSL